jgi:hypothetical protein
MKFKTVILANAILVLTLAATGCGAKSPAATETAPAATEAGAPPMGSYLPESACDHPYYPRRAGTKTQTNEDGTVVIATTSISGDMTRATATVTTTSPNGVDVKVFECSPDGIAWKEWKLYDHDQVQVQSTVSFSGLFFPAAAQFEIGAHWEYAITTHKNVEGGWLESENRRKCTAAAATTVKYHGRSVDALRVDCVNEVTDLEASDNSELEHYFDLYSFYYVYGVGVVGYTTSE